MSATPYFQMITSKSIFASRYKAEKAETFAELEKSLPASKWGRRELFACRVIPKQTPRGGTLPLLDAVEATSRANFSPEMQSFVNGPHIDHLGWSELALVRQYGHSLGQLWAALAIFKGPPGRGKPPSKAANDTRPDNADGPDNEVDAGRSTRIRRNTEHDGYADSSTMQVGSSPPASQGSAGSAGSMAYLDAASHALAAQPEDETLHLIRCTLRHVLCYAPPHAKRNLEAVVEVRDAKVRLKAKTEEGHVLVAVDDGGLCLRRREGAIFETIKNRVVMMEAKARLQCFEDGRPVISDACLSQMTCQAITARLVDPQHELKPGSVIMMHAAQHYVCFLQFDISKECLAELESVAPASFIYVWSSPWYDLSSKDGRINFAQVMCSIMMWAVADIGP